MSTYDAESRRKLLRAFMKARKLNVHAWTSLAKISDSGLRDFLDGRNQTMTDRTYESLAAAANVPASALRGESPLPVEVPLHGYAGAGEVIHQFSGDAQGPLGFERAPPDLINGAAVIVRGDSMQPTFLNEDLIFYEQKELPPERAVGRECIVKLASDGDDGAVLLKRIEKGARKGRYHLVSINKNVRTMEDQAIAWAARIRWIKRG